LLDHLNTRQEGGGALQKIHLFHLRFYNAPDSPSPQFLASTDINTDLTIFVTLETNEHSLRSTSPFPTLRLLVRYNQLLFSVERVRCIIDQLEKLVISAASDPTKAIGSLDLLTEQQIRVLPDPASDLHWGDFKGPIHEIFATNASKHPERPCVVETTNSVEKVYTYRDIHQASNVLAHYLIGHGIDRGDVVMVYAHRGVDLVVAVMGILKSGATFSVVGSPPRKCRSRLPCSRPSISSYPANYISWCRQALCADRHRKSWVAVVIRGAIYFQRTIFEMRNSLLVDAGRRISTRPPSRGSLLQRN
jgi:L-2-aminoadipate reductase